MKKLNRTTAFLIISMAIIISGCGNESPANKTVINKKTAGIILSHNTSMRIAPFIFSSKITQLNKGDTVSITGKSKEKSWIGKTADYWYRVKMTSGITGWIFGRNIRIITAKNKDKLQDFVTEFWEKESEEITKSISGKWWSVNRFNDFTNHGLNIYNDGKYESYTKGKEDNAIEGEFNFDFTKNEIVFLGGTSFKTNLKFKKRGRSYMLYETVKNKELRFKRIQENIKKEKSENENKTK